jgi:glycyl-tRNA synthetase beta chain
MRDLEYDEIQIVTGDDVRIDTVSPSDLFEWTRELRRVVGSPVLASAADAHKRAKRIVEQEWDGIGASVASPELLTEPAEIALREALDRLSAEMSTALSVGKPRDAIDAIAAIQPKIARFFDEVRVVVPDQGLKGARLALLKRFSDAVSQFGDLSVLASKQIERDAPSPKPKA